MVLVSAPALVFLSAPTIVILATSTLFVVSAATIFFVASPAVFVVSATTLVFLAIVILHDWAPCWRVGRLLPTAMRMVRRWCANLKTVFDM